MILDIVFENQDLVLVYKPEGLNFHSEGEAGLVVLVTKQLGVEQLYSVHRLDKMTSGLILLAKSSKIANTLTKLFENRLIEKYYLAISIRKPKKQDRKSTHLNSSHRSVYCIPSSALIIKI